MLPLCGRTNNESTWAHMDMTQPFASGSFKTVYRGKYADGDRQGKPCVLKLFRSGCVFQERYFAHEAQVVGRALAIVDEFNTTDINQGHGQVWVNVPSLWTVQAGFGRPPGELALVEPYIANIAKFNSNTGWTNNSRNHCKWLQSLSHFSYHMSHRCVLLCDLQGGVYSRGVVLTDPVIMSPSRKYGPTDLGDLGISTFFAHHTCTSYCDPNWLTPRDKNKYFTPVPGSTMQLLP
ncbi:hypothetical protein AaE_008172 [Aphanomyces astaci]|uniref:Alpha-type protein kinase domain-containing protein n=1 Tax=Aphanomyces astaci TaxID=112090 RepID=A0A6A5ACB4_APHAT|nr:hypothetical protein AaE_008172 [Aphanomyces astaci]